MRGKIAGLVLCLAAGVYAEDRAVLNEEDVWKLYTTPQVKFMDINGNNTTFAALGIGTILNDHWYFGFLGQINMNDADVNEDSGHASIDRYDMWDAGAEIGYIFAPASLVHLDGSLYFGGGQVTIQDFGSEDESGYVVLEPQVSALINLHEVWELGAGVGYRFTDGVDTPAVSDSDLTDITYRVFLRATEF